MPTVGPAVLSIILQDMVIWLLKNVKCDHHLKK